MILNEVSLKDIHIVKELNRGEHSTIYAGIFIETGEKVVIKAVDKNLLIACNEMYMHSIVKHPDVIRCYGWFFDSKMVYFLLEYSHLGDLWKLINTRGKLTEKEMKHVLRPIIRAIVHMHSLGCIHMDIKAENIIIFNNLRSKLCDLGYSIDVRKIDPVKCIGTLECMAPEVLRCKKGKTKDKTHNNNRYGKEVDSWSIGILVYECLTNTTLYSGETEEEILKQITEKEITFENHQLSEACKQFVVSCLDVNPETRLKSEHMLSHEWLKERMCCF